MAINASAIVAVPCAHGLHLRPAAMVVAACQSFRSEIRLLSGSAVADGKALLSVLQLGSACGSRILIEAEGPDAEEAVAAVAKLFRSGGLLCEEEEKMNKENQS